MTFFRTGFTVAFLVCAGPAVSQSFSFSLPHLTYPPVPTACDSAKEDCAPPAK